MEGDVELKGMGSGSLTLLELISREAEEGKEVVKLMLEEGTGRYTLCCPLHHPCSPLTITQPFLCSGLPPVSICQEREFPLALSRSARENACCLKTCPSVSPPSNYYSLDQVF